MDDDLKTHLQICDAQPDDEELAHWDAQVNALASKVLKMNTPSRLLGVVNDLALSVEGRNGTGVFAGGDPLAACLAAMLATRHILKGNPGVKQGVVAFATWSALSYQAPVETHLEHLRREILNRAQQAAANQAKRVRARRPLNPQSGRGATSKVVSAARANETMDVERIAVLEWLLAGRSSLLDRDVADIERPGAAAVALGLELARLLNRVPDFGHYRLACDFVPDGHALTLEQLYDAVLPDLDGVSAWWADRKTTDLITSYSAVFPLLAALSSGRAEGTGKQLERPLIEWWGRALLEGAVIALARSVSWGEIGEV